MFKNSLKAMKILFKCAPFEGLLRVFQVMITASASPLSIYFTQRLVDNIAAYIRGSIPINNILLWLGLLLICMVLTAQSNTVNQLMTINIQRKLNIALTDSILDKFKNIKYENFEDSETNDTLQRMGANPQDKILSITSIFFEFVSLLISLFGLVFIFMQVSIWFSLSLIIIVSVTVWADFKSMNMMNTMFNNQSKEERRLNYYMGLLSDKHSLLELKIFGAVNYIRAKWVKSNKKVLNERVVTSIKSQKYSAVSTVMIIVWVAFLLFTLVQAISIRSISEGLFISIVGSAGMILSKCEKLSYTFSRMSQEFLSMRHYDKFMNMPTVKENKKEKDIRCAHIVFDNVHFTYPNTDKKILNGVSFEISPYEKVALVGKNGCGKSTIIKLLCRLYKPDSGKILIDGKDINQLSNKQMQKISSVVFQDYASYQLTLRENVAFGNIDKLYDDKSIKKALKMGMAEGISDNLDVNLGKLEEDGTDISGGQWQRLAIARACIAENDFVILDEPTASLDPVAESNMYESFLNMLENKGCLIISHRLASAKMSERIIVLDEGRVIETGNHNSLMHEKRLYCKMYEAQSDWYKAGEMNG